MAESRNSINVLYLWPVGIKFNKLVTWVGRSELCISHCMWSNIRNSLTWHSVPSYPFHFFFPFPLFTNFALHITHHMVAWLECLFFSLFPALLGIEHLRYMAQTLVITAWNEIHGLLPGADVLVETDKSKIYNKLLDWR